MTQPVWTPSINAARLRVRCAPQEPFTLPLAIGSTPGALLQGFFCNVLGDLGHDPERVTSSGPDWFRGPRTLRLQSLDLWSQVPLSTFEIEVRLVGREALRRREMAIETIQTMGQRGLSIRGAGRVRFEINRVVDEEAGTPPFWGTVNEVLVELVTPLVLRARAGESRERVVAGPIPWGWVLGNLAYSVAALEWQESGRTDEAAGKALCDAARAQVQQLAEAIQPVRETLAPCDLGSRTSATGKGEYDLVGITGYSVVRGELTPLAPWFHWLEHWYAGSQNAKGFGDVRVWRPG